MPAFVCRHHDLRPLFDRPAVGAARAARLAACRRASRPVRRCRLRGSAGSAGRARRPSGSPRSACSRAATTARAPSARTRWPRRRGRRSSREAERGQRQPAKLRRQQIAGAAEPGEERGDGGEVDRPDAACVWPPCRPRRRGRGGPTGDARGSAGAIAPSANDSALSTKPITKQPRKIAGQFMFAPRA